MSDALQWLRPWWLCALPLVALMAWRWWRARAGAGPWRAVVDADLLAHLAGRAPDASARLALGIAATALTLVLVALAGPAWRAQPLALHRDLSVRIVVLDLSPSMDAIDLSPSRIERARAAIAAILRDSAGAQLGLVVFGADAFTVAPLSNDPAALIHLLGGLRTGTLPRAGSRPDLGLGLARTLIEGAGTTGDVILVGDSAGDERAVHAARALSDAGYPLSVLAVGTAHGGPVRLASGAFARTEAGEIHVARPEFAALERLAREGGGQYRLLTAGGETPRFARGAPAWGESRAMPARSASQRQDDGAWLALLALPFAALLFRRGWLAAFALAIALPPPLAHAQALDWQDLWRRADQQAAGTFAGTRSDDAARLLARLGPGSPWHALLLYRAGRHAEAAAHFAAQDTADAHYNRGNALALEGQLDAALAAYGAALARNPGMRDALFNRALVRDELAKRPPQASGSKRGQARPEAAPSRSDRRAPAGASGNSATSGDARREAGAGKSPGLAAQRSGPAPARPLDAGTQAGDALDAAQLQRLDRLLADLADDPGALLASRFAQQLRTRGALHYETGPRW